MSGRDVPPELLNNVPDAKPRKPRDGIDIDAIHGTKRAVPLEATVIDAVGDVLRAHPLILFAVRQNSGALPYMSAAGKLVPVWFYKWVKRPEKMRLTDYWFATIDARLGAIECKRENWKGPTDDREREQAKFLEIVRAAGGIGGFARSAEEAKAIIESRPA